MSQQQTFEQPRAVADEPEQENATVRSGRLYRRLWRWHFFAALLVIPFVLWQSGTGLAYLWGQQWVDWRHPELRFVTPQGAMQPISAQVRAVLKRHPSAAVISILPPAQAGRSTAVLLRTSDGLIEPIFVDPYRLTVLGSLDQVQWVPGLTRALHGGWPLGHPGSWLLEIGDGWGIVMVLTGLYLWWPRGRRYWWLALLPRLGQGQRVLWRDLHACVAVWFSLLALMFMISALPWTKFWGGQILRPIQQATHQINPAGFSPGGASGAAVMAALPALDHALRTLSPQMRDATVRIRLSRRAHSPWWIQIRPRNPLQGRTVQASAKTGEILKDVPRSQLPLVAALVAAGVNMHQGDFGWINRWGNTLLALALFWVVLSGFVSWWIRRPGRRGMAIPAKGGERLSRGVIVAVVLLMVTMPLFGLSVLTVLALDQLRRLWPWRGAGSTV